MLRVCLMGKLVKRSKVRGITTFVQFNYWLKKTSRRNKKYRSLIYVMKTQDKAAVHRSYENFGAHLCPRPDTFD